MGRLTGAAASQLHIPCTAHLRDILNLSTAAVADLNRNRRLVAVSHATRDFHVAQGLAGSRVDVIYNGIDCAAFAPRAATGWLKAELRLPADAFLIAAIGQIGLRKGLDVLAGAAVVNRDRLLGAHYLIVGERHSAKPESVTFERSLIECFADAGMSDRLHMLGRRSEVPRLLNEIDLLVHPARQEPFGRVLLEAAASGVPIVASDVGGTREMLDHDSAWLVPAGDAAVLAGAIQDACDRPELRRSKAAAARRRILQDFAIESRAAELGRFWRSVLE
jgi:glycosyltransferase involved in cell wall biosynthesis